MDRPASHFHPNATPLGPLSLSSVSSSLLESTSSHLIALSPQSLPPNRIRLKLIVAEKVNNMVHELPAMHTNDQRYAWQQLPYGAPFYNAGAQLQRGIFDRMLGALSHNESMRAWIGLIMFVLGLIGWRRYASR